MGCGSGLLALHMAKAGAEVAAVDVDERAVANTLRNAASNGLRLTVLRSDLFAVMDAVATDVADPLTRVTAELATLMRHDEQLAEAIRQHLDKEELSPFHDALQRAIARGDIAADADVELIHDVAEAMILRQLHLDRPVDAAFSALLIDDVLLPLLGVAR